LTKCLFYRDCASPSFHTAKTQSRHLAASYHAAPGYIRPVLVEELFRQAE
jgi:hypothetical protein